jgi:hypothetical protein
MALLVDATEPKAAFATPRSLRTPEMELTSEVWPLKPTTCYLQADVLDGEPPTLVVRVHGKGATSWEYTLALGTDAEYLADAIREELDRRRERGYEGPPDMSDVLCADALRALLVGAKRPGG